MSAIVAVWLAVGAAAATAALPTPHAASALTDLEQVDHALVTAELHLREIETEHAALLIDIAGLTAERATAEVREQEAYTDYALRLRSLARMPAGARAMLLGGVRSLADYLEAARLLRWTAAHDRKLRDRYLAESQRLELTRGTLAAREERLRATDSQMRSERDRLALAREQKIGLLTSLLSSRDAAGRTAAEQRLAHGAVVEMLRKLSPAGGLSEAFAKNRGRLPWPTVGPRGAGFGDITDPHFGTTISHPGIDILARSGTPVQAVGPGDVVFAGWLKGYGQVVIVDHGADYHTIYAHLATVKVAVDDAVSAGAGIGTVGDTGSLSGTHLYFEIRHEGVPENPTGWLRR